VAEGCIELKKVSENVIFDMELLKRKIVTEIIVCDSFNIQITIPFSSLIAKNNQYYKKTAFLRMFFG